ncbi:MAG: TonB-dependent receptor [Sphingomonadaceae bacterium]|nr:TonB-dependent receptor [Sphingomonadaceae bacterium]
MAGATLSSTSVSAQENQPQSQPRGEIIVTGRGLADTPAVPAYRVSEIGRIETTSSASGRIEDVLSNIAGFQQFRRSDSRSSNPSAQGVTLRAIGGNATSRALVLLDGVPMAHPFFGYIPLSAIAPERLSSVRVTSGGGSGAFGSGAVSGTIELNSAGPDDLGVFSGSALVNGRAETELSAIAAPRLGSGFAVASVRWDRGKGFHTTPKGSRVPASARARFDSWSTALRAVAPLNDTVELQFHALVFNDDRTLRFEGADSSSSGQDASIRLVGRGDWQFDALGYVQARNFTNVVISSNSFRQVLDQRDTPSTGIGGKFELRPPVGDNHVLRLGADLRIADGKMEEAPFSGTRRAGGRTSDLGLFLENDWALGSVILTAGARADRWRISDGFFRQTDGNGALTIDNRFPDRSGWTASYRGGAVWKAGGGLSLRAAAYTGLRLPTLNELYRPFVIFPVVTQANESLINEKLEGYEAGIEYSPAKDVSLSVTAFDNRLKHAIANVTIGTNLRQRRNVDAIHARGLELAGQIRLGTVSFAGSLAVNDAEVEGSGVSQALDGLRPSQVAKLAASGTLSWQPRDGWRISATLRHTGKQFEDDLESFTLPAATTLGAYAEIPVSARFALVLRAENLFDEKIVTRSRGAAIDLGVPRTIWGGVKLRLGR